MSESNVYRLSTTVEPFMKTQRDANGYTTSYAQIRIHHGTHVDFPPHVGLTGEPRWRLSGRGQILRPAEFDRSVLAKNSVLLFQTDGEDIPEWVVDLIVGAPDLILVGTNSNRVGDLDIHKRLLGESIPLVENLVNLEKPPEREGHVDCFPLVIEGCDDGAIATIAFYPNGKGDA